MFEMKFSVKLKRRKKRIKAISDLRKIKWRKKKKIIIIIVIIIT